jgi:hypothetical protein
MPCFQSGIKVEMLTKSCDLNFLNRILNWTKIHYCWICLNVFIERTWICMQCIRWMSSFRAESKWKCWPRSCGLNFLHRIFNWTKIHYFWICLNFFIERTWICMQCIRCMPSCRAVSKWKMLTKTCWLNFMHRIFKFDRTHIHYDCNYLDLLCFLHRTCMNIFVPCKFCLLAERYQSGNADQVLRTWWWHLPVRTACHSRRPCQPSVHRHKWRYYHWRSHRQSLHETGIFFCIFCIL